GLRSTAGWSVRHFQTVAARRVIPCLALHVDLGPEDLAGAGLGLVLALMASAAGVRVPVGGATSVTRALLRRFAEAGGELRLHAHADRVVVRDRGAVAVRTADGEEIPVRRAVVADVTAPALYLKLLEEKDVPRRVLRSIRRFQFGWGTFKLDWALGGS